MIAEPTPTGATTESLRRYRRRAEVLRQIHSLKLNTYKRRANRSRVLLITASTAATFIGFVGTARLHDLFRVPTALAEPVFDVLLLAVVVAVILDGLFKFDDRANEHQRSIVVLTGLLTDLDDLLGASLPEHPETTLRDIRHRYKLITEILPPTTDAEFLAAKTAFAAKQAAKQAAKRLSSPSGPTLPNLLDPSSQVEWLRSIMEGDSWRLGILRVLKDAAPEGFITGGFVRNAVWDSLHGYPVLSTPDDVDVIYFDRSGEAHQPRISEALRTALPAIPWSVRNQGGTYGPDANDQGESDLAATVSRFPETASAVALRLTDQGIEVIAPVGLEDLVRLILRPTPFAQVHYPHRLLERANEKGWLASWPKLVIASPPAATESGV